MSITIALLIITGLISWQAFSNREMFYKLMHNPYQEAQREEYYRVLTACFVHGNLTHLFINLFVLWQFGEVVEEIFVQIFGATMGRINFLFLYLLTGVFANLPTHFKHRANHLFSSVGASGAVSGVLFAYVLFNPWAILLLFFIIPMPAIVAAVGYLIYSSRASKKGGDMIDHDAHFYGAVFGLLFTIALKPSIFSLFLARLMELPF
jgi:membrane associated rhomboid family serine protease